MPMRTLIRDSYRGVLRAAKRRLFPAPAEAGPHGDPAQRGIPPLGQVEFGSLRRVTPISDCFGYDRGQPVDRYYIEAFLERHRADVRGRVLEVGDASYTRRFGGGRVVRSDVLHVDADNPDATIVADLAAADHLPAASFDCIILTQTLQLVFDVAAAVRTLHRILAPGGVLLLTVPGISQVDRGDWGDTWFWSFTPTSVRRLLQEHFPGDMADVQGHGNVLVASAFLYGLASEELRREEFEHHDPSYPLLITARALKPLAP
jgi:SAM-dependent methyltransferase